MAVTPRQKQTYFNLRKQGFNRVQACKEAGFSYGTGKALDKGIAHDNGREWHKANQVDQFVGPIPYDQLSDVARQAWDDFEFFRWRYMGHISTPWQVETGYRALELKASPCKEFAVENCPPGVGKTTLLHDISAWVTVRDRRIRGLHGSRIENNARRNVRRLRRTFERTSPPRAKSEDVDKGLSRDADACLAQDFGLFKPLNQEVWKSDEFVVAQHDDSAIEEREPTWSAYGMNSGVLSNRFNIIFWDDVVDKATTRSLQAQSDQRLWWDEEAETRLEPEGLLMLVGQRMAASDLYRYNLDKLIPARDDDEDQDEPEATTQPRMYHHIVYRAHYEDRCRGTETHRRDAPAYPDGCLLDPYRQPWRDLRNMESTKRTTYLVSYQQEDADPDDVLVKDVWVWGGDDPDDGSQCPGVMDTDRGLCELPPHLVPPLYSVATVDPSPTKMWATQWWVHAPEAANRTFLMDLERKAMPSNELLDWNADEGVHTGLMEEWQQRSVDLGLPITHWIIEINAAQRFLLPYDHVQRWKQKWGVSIIPHQTGLRKLDPDLGPWLLRSKFKHGNIRLPAKQQTEARWRSMKLIDEVTRWPNPGVTDDEVMAAWFLFVHLPNIAQPRGKVVRLNVPSWVARSRSA